ncbi:type II toxin-antitoxin system ParD family antitoxin [Novosphingobium cyanobacteriorum]|uniref:Type II toxin-antitoxin system ParD family antitoxin n=1 Tax=Novosphingobium cyanobacteriorum TaxID=3024215 RepID=A0ABT6CI99_9SPHN|nr:type II toxin-antitoxin system ParD family antitoxin [Novosphingobium cyanobacteriorum]MDF8333637.1 type II toxin-antitoxin system ParD family antitoxin [Novosphingobium cyanobacteriorum]
MEDDEAKRQRLVDALIEGERSGEAPLFDFEAFEARMLAEKAKVHALRTELDRAFAVPDEEYVEVTVEEVLQRNRQV